MLKLKYLIVLLLVFGLAGSAWSKPLDVKIDFGSGNEMSGWTKKNMVTGTLYDDGTVKIDLSNGGDWWYRTRHLSGSGDDLTSDCLSVEDEGQSGTYSLDITGLTDGTEYTLTSYHNRLDDWFTADPTAYIDLDGVKFHSVTVPSGQNMDSALPLSVTWTAQGGSSKVTWTSSDENWISGFQLTPEPATIALLGMGSLVLLRRRRRHQGENVTRLSC